MILTTLNDINSTQALWVEMTDLEGELVSGGKKNGSKSSKSVVRISIENSNVLIAGGSITLGDNAF